MSTSCLFAYLEAVFRFNVSESGLWFSALWAFNRYLGRYPLILHCSYYSKCLRLPWNSFASASHWRSKCDHNWFLGVKRWSCHFCNWCCVRKSNFGQHLRWSCFHVWNGLPLSFFSAYFSVDSQLECATSTPQVFPSVRAIISRSADRNQQGAVQAALGLMSAFTAALGECFCLIYDVYRMFLVKALTFFCRPCRLRFIVQGHFYMVSWHCICDWLFLHDL